MKQRHGGKIVLGDGLILPDEAVTETFAILGKRGAGKTTTARVLVEGLLEVDLPVLVFDPTGVWWGIRASADGITNGYPVIIFGGDHADVPLEETAGTLIADVLVDQRISAVLDLSHLSKGATRRFCTDLLERLYLKNREPRHVVIDEADLLAPQRVQAGGERLLGAMSDLVRRGRVRGLGVSLVTQRPATLNKDILTQAEVLIALRMTGPRDVQAIDEWVRLHADEDQAREVKASLAALPVGTAWVWSPGWLELLRKVAIRAPRTFDSSATPRPGQQRPAAKAMAPIDLAALGEQITATIDRAKAEDPAQLQRTIAELERTIAALRSELAERPRPAPERIEVPVVPAELVDELTSARQAWQDTSERLGDLLAAAAAQLQTIKAASPPQGSQPPPTARHATRAPDTTPPTSARVLERPAAQRDAAGSDFALPKAQRAILTVLAQHGTRSTTQVALLSRYSAKSGGFRNALSALRSAGLIEGRGDIAATPSGLEALGAYAPLPTGRALIEWWKSEQLGRAERTILDVLVDAYPRAVAVEDIAAAAGYSASSGGFRNALSRLRSLELAAGRGELALNPAFTDS